tara:strand:- start:1112 stop:1282 length:171 start_codon:yes stop_codon:yes gene_type:complete
MKKIQLVALLVKKIALLKSISVGLERGASMATEEQCRGEQLTVLRISLFLKMLVFS